MTHPQRRAALGWALAGGAACAAMTPLEPNLVEEGFALHVAQRLAGGERLYRDVIFFSGPLPFELLAALFRALGESILVARGAVVLLHAAATASVFETARRAGAGPWSHVAACVIATTPILFFPLFSIYFHTTIAFELVLLAVGAACLGLASWRWALVAGALVAAVALSKQSLGAVLAVGGMVVLAAGVPPSRRLSVLGAGAAGAAALAVLTLLLFAARGDLAELYRCTIVFPLSLEEGFRSPFVNLWPLGRFSDEIREQMLLYLPYLYVLVNGFLAEPSAPTILGTQLLYVLPFLLLGATLLRRLRGPLPLELWLHTVGLAALVSNLFPRSDWGHLVFSMPASLVQLVLLLATMRAGPARGRVAGVVVCVVALAAASTAGLFYSRSGPATLGERVPILTLGSMTKNPALSRVIRYVSRNVEPGEAIFVARAEPLIYFATQTRNPTPFEGVMEGFQQEQEAAILEALPEVRYVVMSDLDQPAYTYYADTLPRVQEHLERHYRIPEDFLLDHSSWIVPLEPGPDRGPTAVDLVALRSEGRFWMRDLDGVEAPAEEAPPQLITLKNRRPLAVVMGILGGGVDFDLELPAGTRFQAGVGLHGVRSAFDFYWLRRDSTFAVSIAQPGEDFQRLAAFEVPKSPLKRHRWTPFEVDLSDHGGGRVTLRLEVIPDYRVYPGTLAWWGSPRLVAAPGS